MMKFKKGITFKLFIITAVVFIAFISTTLIFQSVFFEKFYLSKKKGKLKNDIEKFKVAYNAQESADLIKSFEDENNEKIVILDASGNLKFITKTNSERIDAARVKMVNDIIAQWWNSGIFFSGGGEEKVITFVSESKQHETRNVVAVLSNREKGEFIFAITSLQPINEATSVIKEFYLYFYIGAVVIIFLMSFFYSNTVAKPLIEMNETAMKMASLDFSSKCSVKSQDELGSLASSLNTLSENLDESLTSLRKANLKLNEDIEKERKLEMMRKEFTAAVSHELKTPISLIEGYAEALKDNVVEGEDREFYTDVIIDESRKMANLVKDMMDLSQLESGTFKLNMMEFNLSELVRNTVKKFSNPMDNKKISLDLKLDDEAVVVGDADRMEQVVRNMLTNAIRHTESGGMIRILIGSQNGVKVEIENTGKNIPEDELESIWDRFYKVDKSRNRALGGTGLGLSIVKNILQLHESEFGAMNTETGVKFFFTLNKES